VLKRRFYGVRVITITWSRFNTYPHQTRCCVLGKGDLRWLSLLGGFEQATNLVVRIQGNNWKTRKWTTSKRVRIRPKYS